MLKIHQTILVMLILTSTMVITGCSSDSQELVTPSDFYRGKTIDFIVTSSAGSATDRVARVIGSYLERDSGASVVITNRISAGGLEGMNYMYRSEPDGLTLGIVPSVKFVTNKVMDEPAAVYEIDDISYIMNVGCKFYYLMVSPDGPYQSVADLQAGEDLKIGGSSPSGAVSLGGLTVIELLDLDAKVITGITGEANRAPAVKRGEIAGYVINIETARAGIDSGMVEPMFVLAAERDPQWPDIPSITELMNIDEGEQSLVELWGTALVSSDLIAAPPGIPEDRLAFLRGLAAGWAQDEEFCEDMNRVAGHEVLVYETGDDLTEKMLNLANVLDDFRAIFAELIEKYRA